MNKKVLLLTMAILLAFMSICLIFARQIILPQGIYVDETRDTNGTLTFTVRTVTYGGTYAPRHTGVIWITNSSNQFVKTIKIWAASYRNTLVRWMQSSGNNTTGAITGASLTSHQLHTVTWNGTNVSGNLVPDGNYNVNVEFAEHNATSSNMGRYSTHVFNKSAVPIDQTYPNETNFQNLHLVWVPVAANGTINGTVSNNSGNPVSGAVVTAGAQTATSNASGVYTLSIPAGTYTVTCAASTYQTQTQNNVTVTSGQSSTLNFNMGSPLTGIISGTVTNAQSDPISGASVSAGSFVATTNASGIYSMTVTIGTYSVTCSAENYTNHTLNSVLVTTNQTTTVNFNMGNPDLGILTGTVTNEQNEPIQGASVSIGALSDVTDSSGSYTISLLPGTFSVNCSAPNYVTQHQSNIVILSNQTTDLNFVLNPTSLIDDLNTPSATLLEQNFPNPFNDNTTIRFYLKKDSMVDVKIYDTKGKLVRSLLSSQKAKGWHDVIWNAEDNSGLKIPSGKYIYRLSTNTEVYTGLMLFQK